MDPNWRHPHGLHPTLRHLMILVVYFALVFALAAPLLRAGEAAQLTLLLPLTPPLLALLVLMFDRPGPVKYWLVGLIASPTLLGFVAWLDFLAVAMGTHGLDRVFPLLVLLNVLALSSLVLVFKRLPKRCPECGKRSMLPLAQLRWCASCGFRTILPPARRGRTAPPAR